MQARVQDVAPHHRPPRRAPAVRPPRRQLALRRLQLLPRHAERHGIRGHDGFILHRRDLLQECAVLEGTNEEIINFLY